MIQLWSVVRNEAQHIEQMLRSVLGQTYRDWRLVVSDNHSTDGTASIVERYAATDERITLVHSPEPMSGMQHANWLWQQLAAGKADAAMHIGGHDYISHTYVADLLSAMMQRQSAVVTYPQTAYQVDDESCIVGLWGSCPSTVSVPPPFRMLSMLTNMSHNIPFFGLMRWDAFTAVTPSRCCTAHDHLVMAELTLYGDVVEVAGPTLFLRRSPGYGDANVYREKHLPGVSPADDLRQQLGWLRSLCERAYGEHAAGMIALSYFSFLTNRGVDSELVKAELPEVFALCAANVSAGLAIQNAGA